MILEKLALVASSFLFVTGLGFPLATVADPGPSVFAYGILLVSIPAWLLGAALAGAAAWRLGRRWPESSRMRRLAWTLCAINLVAITVCWIWDPEGVS